jgi:hypothetical protein
MSGTTDLARNAHTKEHTALKQHETKEQRREALSSAASAREDDDDDDPRSPPIAGRRKFQGLFIYFYLFSIFVM